MRRISKLVVVGLLLAAAVGIHRAGAGTVTTNTFKLTSLVTNTKDAQLINPWGVAFFPGGPFWISDNNSGFTSLYDKNGTANGSFKIPPPTGSTNPATPTGIVANTDTNNDFLVGGIPSQFIFDTEDGTISGWNGGATVILAKDNSASGAVYKGLAEIVNPGGWFLLAANFNSGKVEVYDKNFNLTNLTGGTFTDPTLPAGYAPFGIHILNTGTAATPQVYVSYALQDAAKHDPMAGTAAGSGIVNIFDINGNFVSRFVSNLAASNLNAPWGVVLAPGTGFGALNGDVLVGNFRGGNINAFTTGGTFVATMNDQNGQPIAEDALWELIFGDGSATDGPVNTLFITAGGTGETSGLFASIVAAAPAANPDFTIASPTAPQSTPAGGSATYTINVTGLNGFNSAVSLTCSGLPFGASCNFNPSSVTPSGANPVSSTLTVTTTRPRGGGYGNRLATILPLGGWFLIGGMGALVLVASRQVRVRMKPAFAGAGLMLLVLGITVFAGGCSSKGTPGTPRGSTTITVTGTSGALSHTTSVMLTVQ